MRSFRGLPILFALVTIVAASPSVGTAFRHGVEHNHTLELRLNYSQGSLPDELWQRLNDSHHQHFDGMIYRFNETHLFNGTHYFFNWTDSILNNSLPDDLWKRFNGTDDLTDGTHNDFNETNLLNDTQYLVNETDSLYNDSMHYLVNATHYLANATHYLVNATHYLANATHYLINRTHYYLFNRTHPIFNESRLEELRHKFNESSLREEILARHCNFLLPSVRFSVPSLLNQTNGTEQHHHFRYGDDEDGSQPEDWDHVAWVAEITNGSSYHIYNISFEDCWNQTDASAASASSPINDKATVVSTKASNSASLRWMGTAMVCVLAAFMLV